MAGTRFSLVMITGATLLFITTISANILFDPEQVFGTDIFPKNTNWNERAGRFEQYKREAPLVDGLLFSSSRGNLLNIDQLAKGMGVSHLMNLSVSYGMVTDHLPILDYILRDKAARGQHIKAVMLLLDPDFFGKTPWTNSNINSFLPPELSGESAVRYWWRYLTVFQFRLWRDVLRSRQTMSASAAAQATTELISANARAPIPTVPENYRRSWNSLRPDLKRQLTELERIVVLCRANDVRLTVAVSPLIQQNLEVHESGMIENLTKRLSTIVPLWDFNSPPLVAARREYWLDYSHFDPTVGTMMMRRMFGSENPPDFTAFGKFREVIAKN